MMTNNRTWNLSRLLVLVVAAASVGTHAFVVHSPTTTTLRSSMVDRSPWLIYQPKIVELQQASVVAAGGEDAFNNNANFNGTYTSSTMSASAPALDDTTMSPPSSSIAAATFGLIKSMVGSGMLALPAALSAITDHPSGLFAANYLLLAMAVMSAYTFSLYGRITHATQAISLGDMWKKVQKSDNSAVVSATTFLFTIGVCLAFHLLFGDAFAAVLSETSIPAWLVSRRMCILSVTLAVLYPLCNLSSLAALAPVSMVGVLGTMVTTLFLMWRCPSFNAASPYAAGGKFLAMAAKQPLFGTYSRVAGPAPLVLMATSCVALMAHFSAPDFYHSLASKSRTTNPNSLDDQKRDDKALGRFHKVTAYGFLATTLINAVTIIAGFLTFGGNCCGIILNNYCSADIGANLSRMLVAVSVIGAYPFLLRACRSAAIELFYHRESENPSRALETKVTTAILAAVTAVSMFVKDAGFVVNFIGALMGSNIIYTLPCFLFLKMTADKKVSGNNNNNKLLKFERNFCRFLIGFGVFSAVVGAATSVVNTFYPHLLL